MKVFDSHAHLDDNRYDEDRDEVLERSLRELAGVINPGTDLEDSRLALALAKRYERVWAAVGFHPHEARLMQPGDEQRLAELAGDAKVVAIGEIGLDYFYDHSPREVQRSVLIRQLDLARQLALPVIIHDRDAHGDIMEIIKREGKGVPGVFHCFSGSWEMAQELLKCGFYVAFGGPLTFTNAVKLQEIARKVPLERILLETDSPYLTPHPLRGRRNEPVHVQLVAKLLAELRGLSVEAVAEATTNNVQALFGIKLTTPGDGQQ